MNPLTILILAIVLLALAIVAVVYMLRTDGKHRK